MRSTDEDGAVILRGDRPFLGRRVLLVSEYGMADAWRQWAAGTYPGQHLWGCLELARLGYEILLPEPRDHRLEAGGRSFAAAVARLGRERLDAGDVVYCQRPILPLTVVRGLRAAGCKAISLLHGDGRARELSEYDGLIGLTPAGHERAARANPRALRAHIPWGVDLPFYPEAPYEPRWVLSCGKTLRDFACLAEALEALAAPAVVIAPIGTVGASMPAGAEVISRARDDMSVSYDELRGRYYRHAAVVVIALRPEPGERDALGITNLLEALALARPVVLSRVGAVAREVDVEAEEVGVFVEPGDADALGGAIAAMLAEPERAEEMGRHGRALCERRYTMERFGSDLHAFLGRL